MKLAFPTFINYATYWGLAHPTSNSFSDQLAIHWVWSLLYLVVIGVLC